MFRFINWEGKPGYRDDARGTGRAGQRGRLRDHAATAAKKRRRNKMKILYWDQTSFPLWLKRPP